MQSVKVLPKGQITLPKGIREELHIKEGDTLLFEESLQGVILKKGKTLFDYAGILPNPGIPIEKIREKAVEEAVKDHA